MTVLNQVSSRKQQSYPSKSFSTAGEKIYYLRRACVEPLSISCSFYSVRPWDFAKMAKMSEKKFGRYFSDFSGPCCHASAILPGPGHPCSLCSVQCAGPCGPCRKGSKLRCPMANLTVLQALQGNEQVSFQKKDRTVHPEEGSWCIPGHPGIRGYPLTICERE